MKTLVLILFLLNSTPSYAVFCSKLFSHKQVVISLTKRATRLKSEGKIEQAIDTYAEALKIDPNNAIALTQGGYLSMLVGRQARARRWLDHGHKIEPDNRQVFWNRIQVRLAQGDVEALETLLYRMGDSFLKIYTSAGALILKGRPDTAIALLETLRPTPSVLRLKARAYHAHGRNDLAYESLHQALLKNPARDFFTIVAMMNIERQGLGGREYKISDELWPFVSDLPPQQIRQLYKASENMTWKFQPEPANPNDIGIVNRLWTDDSTIFRPIDSNAVREIRRSPR